MKIGIIGLSKSGRTTIHHILGVDGVFPLKVKGAKYKGSGATVDLPDERVEKLTQLYSPKKTTPIKMEFVDIEGAGGSFDRSFLDFVRDCDGLLHIVRDFSNPLIPHPSGTVDPKRDKNELMDEMILGDLDLAERRLEKAKKEAGNGQETAKRELPFLIRVCDCLREQKLLSSLDMPENDWAILSHYGFLTKKPILTVYNIDEGKLGIAPEEQDALYICADLELELGRMEGEERDMMASELGLDEPARDKIIKGAFQNLGQISFFTAGVPEVKAWPLKKGLGAKKAAGKIHSDLEKGFIRAEIIGCDELLSCGSLEAARKKNLVHSEGADYEVKDGEVLLIRFNL